MRMRAARGRIAIGVANERAKGPHVDARVDREVGGDPVAGWRKAYTARDKLADRGGGDRLSRAGGALWLHWSTAPFALRAVIFLTTYLAVYFGISTIQLRRARAAQFLLGEERCRHE